MNIRRKTLQKIRQWIPCSSGLSNRRYQQQLLSQRRRKVWENLRAKARTMDLRKMLWALAGNQPPLWFIISLPLRLKTRPWMRMWRSIRHSASIRRQEARNSRQLILHIRAILLRRLTRLPLQATRLEMVAVVQQREQQQWSKRLSLDLDQL